MRRIAFAAAIISILAWSQWVLAQEQGVGTGLGQELVGNEMNPVLCENRNGGHSGQDSACDGVSLQEPADLHPPLQLAWRGGSGTLGSITSFVVLDCDAFGRRFRSERRERRPLPP